MSSSSDVHRTPSRYRSQRKSQHGTTTADDDAPELPAVPDQTTSPNPDAGVARSKSRYRRKNSIGGQRPPTDAHDEPSPPLNGAQPSSPVQQDTIAVSSSRPAGRSQSNANPKAVAAGMRDGQQRPPTNAGRAPPNTRRARGDETGAPADGADRREGSRMHPSVKQKRSPVPAQSNGHPAALSQQPRANGLSSTPQDPMPSVSPPVPQTTTQDLFPPPKPKEKPPPPKDQAPTSEQIRATKTNIMQPAYEFDKDDDDGEGGGCFGWFKRKRELAPATEKTPIARPATGKGERNIKMGGGGAVPGVDAPLSAVNAGDRRVLIEYGRSRITLPVNPNTTPADLIKSASNVMSERIDVKSAVLLEHFGTVGVQRPLRRYERVRDVMNSWDNDQQNSLLVVDPGTNHSEAELGLQGVPASKPGGQEWLMYYSQKPGKWDRRLIALKSDGQLTMSKDPNKPTDAINLCHLSDFDIYTPTADKAKRKIKPPKRICHAVKSQQKTSMFESHNNFVHFFCTGEKRDADSFYAAVQGWRSWYLVNVMGEGTKDKNPPPANMIEAQEAREEEKAASKLRHRAQDSVDSHYQLGSFKPLLEMDVNAFGEGVRPKTSDSQKRNIIPGNAFANASPMPNSGSPLEKINSPERRMNSTKRKCPPVALNRMQLDEDEPLANLDRKRTSHDGGRPNRVSLDQRSPANNEFSDTGLLGRNYSQKRKEQEDSDLKQAEPWTAGPNLLNGGYDVREGEYVGRRTSIDGATPGRDKSQRAPKRPAHKATSGGDFNRSKSTRISHEPSNSGGDLQRSTSRKGGGGGGGGGSVFPGQPLIDLTPQYREPPQHQKKGHGHKPDHVGPGGLIDAATSLEDPLGIPESTKWRGRRDGPGAQPSPVADTFGRSKSRARSHSRSKPSSGGGADQRALSQHRPTTSHRDENNHAEPMPPPNFATAAFTGEGLLAGGKAGSGWGSAQRGRGVMDGSHARGPMLDVKEGSKFVQGSLLNRVEMEQGGPGPVIDREKRDEREIVVGEAF